MRYNRIRSMDISNGNGIGVSLFVQGCPLHCKGCFNPETWDFGGGKPWMQEVEDYFLQLAGRPQVQRVSILGGEPFAAQNIHDVGCLIKKLKCNETTSGKKIWVYSGYRWETLTKPPTEDSSATGIFENTMFALRMCDVLVDGQYIDSLRDLSLKWKGSANQRVIDVQRTLADGAIAFCT